MSKLSQFEAVASPAEFRELAQLAGTSSRYLYNLARGYSRRSVSVNLALRIESASRVLRAKNRKLPAITCADLAELSN